MEHSCRNVNKMKNDVIETYEMYSFMIIFQRKLKDSSKMERVKDKDWLHLLSHPIRKEFGAECKQINFVYKLYDFSFN